jgi:molybdate transport system ATP-binding protein
VTPREPALTVAGRVERGAFALELDAHVAAGEVLGVLGPNGSGKTTLLRVVAGLEALTTGSIRLGGVALDDVDAGSWVPPEHRPVGIVFQDYRLFPHLSVRDNVAFAPRSRGAGRAEARATADNWVERLGLAPLSGRKPRELSGGQAQRVALARALAADPGVLLLDEPLAALDARTRLDVRTALRGHLSEFDGPVLVVTHDPLEAMVMADRLLVVEDGVVVQEGSPSVVARHPATDYVARLVGLNLYAGALDRSTGTVTLDGGGRLMATVSADQSPEGDDSRVLVALQPSAVGVHTTQPDHLSPRNVWPGTVVGLELLGDRVRLEIRGEPVAIVDVTPAAVAELGLVSGSAVWLTAKATETVAYAEAAVRG